MIQIKINGTVTGAVFAESAEIEESLQEGRQFERTDAKFGLSLIGSDFELIMATPFETKFLVDIEHRTDPLGAWVLLAKAAFSRTACKIDLDAKMVEVTLTPEDPYSKILKGMDFEQDLIKLAPEIIPVSIAKRPTLQLYTPGSDHLTNVLGGNYWEQDAVFPESHPVPLMAGMAFTISNILKEVYIATAPGNIAGLYAGELARQAIGGSVFYNGNLYRDGYSEHYVYMSVRFIDVPTGQATTYTIELRSAATNTAVYSYVEFTGGEYEAVTVNLQHHVNNSTIAADVVTHRIYARYLLDVLTYKGNPTYEIIQDGDVAGPNSNYSRMAQFPGSNVAKISTRLSQTPTEWGLNRLEQGYYLPPDDINAYIPVNRNRWGVSSAWMLQSSLIDADERAGRTYGQIKDTYPIHSVIDKLVKSLDPSLSFKGTSLYSSVLYGSDFYPIPELTITPKSNVTSGSYDRPASRAPITLGGVLGVLKSTMNLDWFIENGRFRIEHVSFFEKGYSYGSGLGTQLDLTTAYCPQSGENWDYLTNTYEYDQNELEPRIEFTWGDKSSEVFEGVPILAESAITENGQKRDINTGAFTTDVDFMLVAPQSISREGFALLALEYDPGSGHSIKFNKVNFKGFEYDLQNGFLSWPNLHRIFWLHNLPVKEVYINDEFTLAASIRKTKKQTVTVPRSDLVNFKGLIKTGLGLGRIDKKVLNLHDLSAKITLRYDTY